MQETTMGEGVDVTDDPLITQTAQAHQAQRMSALPDIYKTTHERLACELALEMEEPEVIFSRYGYTPDQAVTLMESTGFASLLARVGKEIRETGMSFRAKARAQAEELLGHSFQIATDPEASTAERVKIIQWTAKMGGLEPKEKEDGAKTGGFTLNLTFAGEAPTKVVTGEHLTIDQED